MEQVRFVPNHRRPRNPMGPIVMLIIVGVILAVVTGGLIVWELDIFGIRGGY